jgi:hypothetical protein
MLNGDRIETILQRDKEMKRANKAVITGLVIRKKKRKNNLVLSGGSNL